VGTHHGPDWLEEKRRVDKDEPVESLRVLVADHRGERRREARVAVAQPKALKVEDEDNLGSTCAQFAHGRKRLLHAHDHMFNGGGAPRRRVLPGGRRRSLASEKRKPAGARTPTRGNAIERGGAYFKIRIKDSVVVLCESHQAL